MHDSQNAFRALADPTRRAIVTRLAGHDMTIAEVAENFAMTRTAVRKHLAVLEEGALISIHPRGRERLVGLNPTGLKLVADWVSEFNRFWDERLSVLQTVINEKDRT